MNLGSQGTIVRAAFPGGCLGIRPALLVPATAALVFIGADRLGDQTTLQAEAQGALSFADGGLFASSRIDDSFAVVDTNGIEGILVKPQFPPRRGFLRP